MPGTDEVLRNGRLIAALLVRHRGEACVTLFDRIDEEVRWREAASDRLKRALQLFGPLNLARAPIQQGLKV